MTEELIVETYKLVTSFLRKHTKYYDEDLLQELVIKIYQRYDKFDPNKASFPTFVYMNCKNYYLMHLKAKKDFHSLDEVLDTSEGTTLMDIILDAQPTILESIIQEEKEAYVKYIYDNICSPMLQDYFKGIKQKDLAVKYGLFQGNVSRSIKNELTKLKETYGE